MFYLVLAGALYYDAGRIDWQEGQMPVMRENAKECFLLGQDLVPWLKEGHWYCPVEGARRSYG